MCFANLRSSNDSSKMISQSIPKGKIKGFRQWLQSDQPPLNYDGINYQPQHPFTMQRLVQPKTSAKRYATFWCKGNNDTKPQKTKSKLVSWSLCNPPQFSSLLYSSCHNFKVGTTSSCNGTPSTRRCCSQRVSGSPGIKISSKPCRKNHPGIQ